MCPSSAGRGSCASAGIGRHGVRRRICISSHDGAKRAVDPPSSCPVRPPHQGSGPSAFEKVPLGPSAPSNARRTGSRAASYFLQRLRPVVQTLLDDAIAAGELRAGIQADELLCAVGALCGPLECPKPPDARRLVALFIDGLRYGAGGARPEKRVE
ncbi:MULTISPECIES: hypothetical protein [Burkholderia cepacia complex]|uniref:SbtR family transcriptional regulator n=1 Tax=Burkholderia cepacia complex TaxID=87882 RepID=UPI0039C5F1E3